jgi:hypothetical protein
LVKAAQNAPENTVGGDVCNVQVAPQGCANLVAGSFYFDFPFAALRAGLYRYHFHRAHLSLELMQRS